MKRIVLISCVSKKLPHKTKWYILGAGMTDPIKGGLGEYIQKNFKPLSPRHASAIAAIMVKEQLLDYKGLKPILLKRVV